jgi:hypothetical protein
MCGNYISSDNAIFESNELLKEKLKVICKDFLQYEKDELYKIKAWFSILEIHQENKDKPDLSIYMNTSNNFGDEGVYNIGFHSDLHSVINTYEQNSDFLEPEYNGFDEFIKINPEHNYVTCDSRKGNYLAKIFTEEQFIERINKQISSLSFYQFSVGEILGLEPLTKSDFSRHIYIQTRGGFTGWNLINFC